jgi:hypothetical protein
MFSWGKRKQPALSDREPDEATSPSAVDSAPKERELQWDPADFLLHFGVQPEVWQDGESYAYQVRRKGACLMLHVWPHRSAVYPAILVGDKTILTLGVIVRSPVRRRTEHWGEFLDFPDCVVIPKRHFHGAYSEAWDGERDLDGITLSIRVTPNIEVMLQ